MNDVIKGIAFGFAQIPYIITNYKDYKRPKTFGELDNYSIFEFLDRANTDDFSRSEVSSGGIMANARGKYFFEKLKLKNTLNLFLYEILFLGIAKLASIMANKGGHLMSKETWNVLHSKPKKSLFFNTPGTYSILHANLY
jgi:hypothetical protein